MWTSWELQAASLASKISSTENKKNSSQKALLAAAIWQFEGESDRSSLAPNVHGSAARKLNQLRAKGPGFIAVYSGLSWVIDMFPPALYNK